jgi:hypothetical protein
LIEIVYVEMEHEQVDLIAGEGLLSFRDQPVGE